MIPMPGQLYHHLYEGIAVGWKKGKKKNRISKYNFEDVFALDRQRFSEYINELIDIWYEKRDCLNKYEHATQKPVKLPERAIRVSSRKDDIALDVFGGSGSTLLACEQLGRRGYLMELDPKYCDVIRKRYNDFVNKD